MRRLAIVPARGASKRIPHKNVVVLAGKPLLAWSIEAARSSGLFDAVVVSTDDEEIAAVARAHGAEVPFLREAYGDDHSPVSLASVEMVERLQAAGREFDRVVQLLPTCPLRTADDVREALEAFETKGRSLQISCFEYGWVRPWWAVRLDAAGRPTPLFPEVEDKRSQDLEPLYCPSGATWVARTDALLRARTFFGPGHVYQVMPMLHAVDIDEPADLELARQLLIARSVGRDR